MTKQTTLFVTILTFFSITLFAQEGNIATNYKRVTIPKSGADFLLRLAETGVDLHCGAIIEENSVQLELSEYELQDIAAAGFSYNVLIDDLTKYYSERAQRELPTAMRNLELEKQFARFQRAQSFQQVPGTQASNQSIGQIFLNNIAQPESSANEIDWVSPQNFVLGTMGGMVTISEMETQLDQMRTLFPNLITAKTPISSTLTTWEGRNVWYVKISDNPDTDENEPETLITSNIHAREAAAITNNMFFMWYLLENYATDLFVKNLVDNTEIYFIPMVNPDGVARNQSISPGGGGMQRKNLRPNTCTTDSNSANDGVDLNRNFDYWYANPNGGSSTDPCSDSYRGPSAFSEPESRMLRDFVLAHQFKTVQMHHSFANSIPHPFGGDPLTLTGREDEYHKFHLDMTQYNRYVFGPTIFPAATGIADDWMLGGGADNNGKTGSGQAILATTPESGSSAEGSFWPSPATLPSIAKRAMRINFINVLYAMKFAVLHDLTPSNITTQTVNLQFGIERLGQTAGNFTLTVTPVSPNIVSIASPATQTGMSVLEQRNVTAVMQLNSNIGFDEEIRYRVKLSNEGHDIYEAEIVKVFSPQVAFFDNAEAGNLNNWAGGTWVNTNSTAFNGSRSFTDAAAVAYTNNLNKSISLANPLNLQAPVGKTMTKILVQFYTKWDIERNFDFVEFQGSTNGTTWVSLNGLYNKPSAKLSTNGHVGKTATNEQFQQNGTLVYDGDQMNKWVMEEIVIDPTQNSFLYESPTARFRFLFRTDGTNLTDNYTTSFDGFFFDDFRVLKIVEPPTLSVVDNELKTIKISPNPFKSNIQISWPELSGEGFTATIYDLQGRLIKQQVFTNGPVQTLSLDTSLSQGLYLLKLRSESGLEATQKLVKM